MGRKEPNPGPPRYVAAYICNCGIIYPARLPYYPFLSAPDVCSKCGTLQQGMSHESVLEIQYRERGRFFNWMRYRYERIIKEEKIMNAEKVEIGDLAKDVITGFTGVVKYCTEYMHNCDSFGLQPQELKDGVPVKLEQFDAPNVVVVRKKVIPVIPAPRSVFGYGDVVADTLTDFKGTMIACAYWISGCTRIGVQSTKLKDEKCVDWEWFPMGQLKLIKAAKKPKPEQKDPPGGPMPMSRPVQGPR